MRRKEFKTPTISYTKLKTEIVPERMNKQHCHDCYELLYIIDGKGKYVVEGVELQIEPGMIMIFPPFTYHCVDIEPGIFYERIVIYFNKNGVTESALEAFTQVCEEKKDEVAIYLSDSVPTATISILEDFYYSIGLPKKQMQVYASLRLSEVLVLLSASESEEYYSYDVELGAQVIKYLNEFLTWDIPLDQIAKRFFVSKYHLCRAFKNHNGISIHGYVTQKRITKAKALIEAGESAANAARIVGFKDYSSFYRAYVKLLGYSPTAFKEGRGK